MANIKIKPINNGYELIMGLGLMKPVRRYFIGHSPTHAGYAVYFEERGVIPKTRKWLAAS